MSDESLVQYSPDLAAEIEETIRSGDGAVYSEEEFTRFVLDKLGDEGALDNPISLSGRHIRTEQIQDYRLFRRGCGVSNGVGLGPLIGLQKGTPLLDEPGR